VPITFCKKLLQSQSEKLQKSLLCEKDVHKILVKLTPAGVFFMNILLEAFVHSYPESTQRYRQLVWIFTNLGSRRIKALSKMLVQLTPGWRWHVRWRQRWSVSLQRNTLRFDQLWLRVRREKPPICLHKCSKLYRMDKDKNKEDKLNLKIFFSCISNSQIFVKDSRTFSFANQYTG